jgi:uncharacterized DUF497 family protein
MPFARRLVWDPRNVAHVARHRMTVAEVEEACHIAPMFSQTYMGRIRVIGPTHTGRMLTVILDPEGEGVYYPVTARPASRKERRRYREAREG